MTKKKKLAKTNVDISTIGMLPSEDIEGVLVNYNANAYSLIFTSSKCRLQTIPVEDGGYFTIARKCFNTTDKIDVMVIRTSDLECVVSKTIKIGEV